MLFHMMFNAYWEPLVFELPPVETGVQDPGDDGSTRLGTRRTTSPSGPSQPPVQGPTCAVQPRSLVVLFAEGGGATH